MKNVFRWTLLALLLCSIPASAEKPRETNRLARTEAKPLIVDGVRYDPSTIDLFKDQPMYWVVEKDAVYGFTTPEGAQAYGQEHAKRYTRPGRLTSATGATYFGSGCSGFNKNVGCGGTDWLPLCPPSQKSYLPDSWNDVISCVETGSDVGYYTVLYKCYYFSASTYDCYSHIHWIAPGVTITDLNNYQMNNIVSSIRFCSNVDPFSCTQ